MKDAINIKYAPVTSYDVEVLFSMYKNVLTAKRHNLNVQKI